MTRFIATIIVVTAVAALVASCDALQTLGPAVAGARNFTFHYQKVPPEYDIVEAAELMAHRQDSLRFPNNFADRILTGTAEVYHGNKSGNTNHFTLLASEPGAATRQGGLFIQVQDRIKYHSEFSGHIGAAGLNIDAIPLPVVGDTVTSALFTLTVTEDGDDEQPNAYVNDHAEASYLRLVVTSIDRDAMTCAGTFEALVQADSGTHAGAIYAITDGEFLMNIRE